MVLGQLTTLLHRTAPDSDKTQVLRGRRMKRVRRLISIVLWCVVSFSSMTLAQTPAGQDQHPKITIHYSDYDVQNVPMKATAYAGSKVMARAEATYPVNSGAFLKVTETYYSDSGSRVYQGTLLLKKDFGRYIPIDEKKISGSRPYRAFRDWPAGR